MEREVNTIRFDAKTVASIVFVVLALAASYWANRSAIVQLEKEVVKVEAAVDRMALNLHRIEVEVAALEARSKP